jgi:hypothetical protein
LVQLHFAPPGSNPVGTVASAPSCDAVAGSIPRGGPGVFGFVSALESRYHRKRLTDLCLSSRPTPAAGPVRNPEQPEFSPPRYGQSDPLFAAVHESAIGPYRKSASAPRCGWPCPIPTVHRSQIVLIAAALGALFPPRQGAKTRASTLDVQLHFPYRRLILCVPSVAGDR